MKPSICICCGEPMNERGNALSRNPNVCASCSSLADGIDDSGIGDFADGSLPEPSTLQTIPEPRPERSEEEVVSNGHSLAQRERKL